MIEIESSKNIDYLKEYSFEDEVGHLLEWSMALSTLSWLSTSDYYCIGGIVSPSVSGFRSAVWRPHTLQAFV